MWREPGSEQHPLGCGQAFQDYLIGCGCVVSFGVVCYVLCLCLCDSWKRFDLYTSRAFMGIVFTCACDAQLVIVVCENQLSNPHLHRNLGLTCACDVCKPPVKRPAQQCAPYRESMLLLNFRFHEAEQQRQATKPTKAKGPTITRTNKRHKTATTTTTTTTTTKGFCSFG